MSGVGGAAKIRVGIVGANPLRGWAVTAHLPALVHLPEFEITAVATTRLESARQTAAAFNVPVAVASADDLIARDDVDVVVVSVKVTRHAEIIHAALEAGKHVFSEWPLGVDLEQASALALQAEAKGVTHLIGLQGLVAPGVHFVRDLIAQGRIGRVLSVSTVASSGLGGARISETGLYTVDRAAGATVLQILGGHHLAALVGTVGEFRQVSGIVTTVTKQATVIETGQRVEVTSPDQVAVAGILDGGAVVSATIQGGSPPGIGFFLRIVGTEGALDIRPAQGGGSMHMVDWAVSAIGADGSVEEVAVPQGYGGIPDAVPAGPPRNIAALYQELGHAIRDGRPAVPGFDTAVHYHRLLETIQRAGDSGARQEASNPG